MSFLAHRIKPHLVDASKQYPNFETWYSKVSTELLYGLRSIVFIYHKNDIAAFSILKHSDVEKKICTFYTVNKYRRNHIGNLLMQNSLQLLGSGSVLITMPDKKVDEFRNILSKYNFVNQNKIMNYYNKNEEEYFFIRNSVPYSRYIKELPASHLECKNYSSYSDQHYNV